MEICRLELGEQKRLAVRMREKLRVKQIKENAVTQTVVKIWRQMHSHNLDLRANILEGQQNK